MAPSQCPSQTPSDFSLSSQFAGSGRPSSYRSLPVAVVNDNYGKSSTTSSRKARCRGRG